MSISELGSLGEFIGSLVVLVTLVYLVFQLRQNTLSMRSQSRYFVLEALNADMQELTDPEFFRKSERVTSADATTQEVTAYSMHINGWLSHLEMLFLEIHDGALPEAFENTLRWRLASLFVSIPLGPTVWENWRGYYTGGFQEYVDNLLQEDLATVFAAKKH
jgi:hypothetical protein